MSPAEWVRATNALTALEQCGNALAKSAQEIIATLTMANAVMERTRLWLAEAEPQAEPRPTHWPPPLDEETHR